MTQGADNLTGGRNARDIERRQWSDIQRVTYDMVLKGRGEYFLDDPIYFGRAFTSPPAFSYSANVADFDNGIWPEFTVPPKGAGAIDVDANGLSSSAMTMSQIIWDSGFEWQGQFVGKLGATAKIIPTVSSLIDGDSQIIADTWNFGESQFPREPATNQSNGWAQTDTVRGFWELSDTESNDFGIGARGSWSAKYEFEVDGESNLLVPIDLFYDSYVIFPTERGPWDLYGIASTTNEPPESTTHDTHSTAATGVGPYGFKGYASVLSDAACQFRLEIVTFHDQGGEIDDAPDVAAITGFTGSPFEYGSYREMDRIVIEYDVEPGKWNDFKIDVNDTTDYNNHRSVGNFPITTDSDGNSLIYAYNRYEYSVVGTAGQTVYLDNLYLNKKVTGRTIPIITIGVAEWVVDEYGAYIGAKLWFKVGTPDE